MDRPTSKRKEREREARRESILDAAAGVFSRKSYFEATLDEISAEAELAKGTLYNYYKDKQDIFVSLVERGLFQFRSALEQVMSAGGTLQEMLTRCFESSLKVTQDHLFIHRLILTSGLHLSAKVKTDVMKRFQEQSMMLSHKLAETFAAMPETSKLSPADRLTGAQLVFSAIHGLHHRLMADPKFDSMQDEIKSHVRLLSRALTVE